MSNGCRISGPHIIKLNDKRIQVQIEYHSPPKKERKERVREVTLLQLPQGPHEETAPFRKMKKNSSTFLRRYKNFKQSPYFYHKNIQQTSYLLADYEAFHERMAQKEVEPQKLKVYSNSKELKVVAPKHATKPLANQDTNMQNASKATHFNAPLRKIKLYSPSKTPSRHKGSLDKSTNIIRLHGNAGRHNPLRGTPERGYRLEVTSSKSRNKFDSMISNKEQKSFQNSKLPKQDRQQPSPEPFLKSFNEIDLSIP